MSLPTEIFGGRFEVISEAGRGGMSTVYKARDQQTGALVAVKVLTVETSDSSHEAERFRREAAILAELHHPSIVSYITSGKTTRGQLFLAMEWLDGEDLSQRLSRGVLTIQECLRLMHGVASALDAAHCRGIVHRDLKPSNIFLRGSKLDNVALLDFGIARAGAAHANLTVTGAIIGTPEYMAPEQARGQHQLSPAADIFSLGCVLFECLTKQTPFPGQQFAVVLAKILFDQPPSLRTLRPGAPEALEVLIAAMLHKEPKQRLINAQAVLQALHNLGPLPDDDGRLSTTADREGVGAVASIEQQVVCLVLAVPGGAEQRLDATLGMTAATAMQDQSLRAELGLFGGRSEWLGDGSLVVTIQSIGSLLDQAVLAARCALLVQERWTDAVVGMAVGRAVLSQSTPVGEVLSRAAHLVQHSSRGAFGTGVRLDALSSQLLTGRFDILPTPDGGLLRGERSHQDELRLLLGKPTPCVGREYELRLLDTMLAGCIEESVAKELLILGVPGTGKSRLRHEFLRRAKINHPQLLVLTGRGDPMTAGSPYGLLAQAITGLCGINRSAAQAQQREQLSKRAQQYISKAMKQRVTVFLGEICGIRFPDEDFPPLAAARRDPKVMTDQVSAAFVEWLRAESTERPVVLVLEDLHWGDALTVQLVNSALDLLAEQPLLVLSFARPEVADIFPKLSSGHQQELRLRGLNRSAAERLIREVLGPQVSPETTKWLIERADGNALYLEELIRAVAEGKQDSMPETVMAMLQARLSRFDTGVRRMARVASIFGLTFWDGAVRALHGTEAVTNRLPEALATLVSSEVIKRNSSSRFSGQEEFAFRHPLMRDAAYSLLSDSDRELGHKLAGRYLEDHGEGDAGVLAEHYRLGKEHERAVACYLRAAQFSVESNDLHGALERAHRGLECRAHGEARGKLLAIQCAAHMFLDNWDTAHALGTEAFGLLTPGSKPWTKLISSLFVVTSLTPERRGQFEQLIGALCSAPSAPDAQAAYVEAMSWLVIAFSSLGLRNEASAFLGMMRTGAEPIAKTDAISRGWMHFGHTSFVRMLGRDPLQNLQLAQLAASSFEEAGDRRNFAHAISYVGLAYAELGDLVRGEELLRAALDLSQRLGERLQVACASVYLASVLVRNREAASLAEATALARAVTEEAGGNFFFVGIGYAALARAQLSLGSLVAAENAAQQAHAMLRLLPTVRQYAEATLAEVLLQKGQAEQARAIAEAALPHADSFGGYGQMGVRLAAVKACLAVGDTAAAKQRLTAALAVLDLMAACISSAEARAQFLSGVEEVAELHSLGHILLTTT